MRLGRWFLTPDDSGERDGYWLSELGGEPRFIATGDLNTLMRLFTSAWKRTRPTRRCRYCKSTEHMGNVCKQRPRRPWETR